jgi:DNA-binding CsgD family transcriptional regulator
LKTRPASSNSELLIRRLVRALATQAGSVVRRGADGESDKVILDVELDGVRCLLVRSEPTAPRAKTVLSPREIEIARMIAKGHPNKTIAAVLEISPWTVSTHLRRIFSKLGVGSRAAMVARLLEDGLTGEPLRHAGLVGALSTDGRAAASRDAGILADRKVGSDRARC